MVKLLHSCLNTPGIIRPSIRLLDEIISNSETVFYIYPPSFVISIILLLKRTFYLHKATVCPTGFRETFAGVFVLVYCWRQFLCL